MKINQKGFSLAETLVVVLILCIIGGAGWYVYDYQKNKNTENTKSSSLQDNEKRIEHTEESPEYKSKRYTSSKGTFSMELLNGWTVEKDTTYDYFFQYSVSKIKYDEAVLPTVNETDKSGIGGFVPGIKVSVNEYNEEISSGEKFILNDGTTGYCNESVTTKADDDLGLMADNMGNFISNKCFFKKNSKKLLASYGYYEKEPLDVKSVEYSFKTITFEN